MNKNELTERLRVIRNDRLLYSAQNCDAVSAERALREGADPNCYSRYVDSMYGLPTTKSALEYATESGCLEIVHLLLRNNCTLESEPREDFYVNPSLRSGRDTMYAVCSKPHRPFNGNETLFFWSLQFLRPLISRSLFDHYVAPQGDLAVRDALSEALFIATEVGNVEMMQLILDISKENLSAGFAEIIGATSSAGNSALIYAATYGDLDLTQKLLDSGADVNYSTPRGATALYEAIYNGHEALALLLIDSGSRVDTMTVLRSSPLSQAKKLKLDRVISAIQSHSK